MPLPQSRSSFVRASIVLWTLLTVSVACSSDSLEEHRIVGEVSSVQERNAGEWTWTEVCVIDDDSGKVWCAALRVASWQEGAALVGTRVEAYSVSAPDGKDGRSPIWTYMWRTQKRGG
jgi:hypothetical protein